jgi:hypothetical protein
MELRRWMSRRKLPVSHTSLDISAAVDSYIYKYVQKTMRHMQQEGSLQSWIDVEQGLAPSLDKDPPASGSHKSPPTLSVSPSHDAVLAPFSRPVPDDILLSICAALDGMKESVVYRETSDGDRIVQRTLLSLQLVSKAGWRAATPFIWRTLKFKRDEDYISFYDPITVYTRAFLRPPDPHHPRWVGAKFDANEEVFTPTYLDRFSSLPAGLAQSSSNQCPRKWSTMR